MHYWSSCAEGPSAVVSGSVSRPLRRRPARSRQEATRECCASSSIVESTSM